MAGRVRFVAAAAHGRGARRRTEEARGRGARKRHTAMGDGDEGGSGGSDDGRRRRRVRKKKRPPYIGEGPLVSAPVNAQDEKIFSPGWYYEPLVPAGITSRD